MASLQQAKISFIGGGNMAAAIIGGLLVKDIPQQNIHVSEPWDVNRAKMAAQGVRTTTSNLEAAQDADVVILAVKPQVCQTVCEELGAGWCKEKKDAPSAAAKLPLVISITAGNKVESIAQWFKQSGGGSAPHIVRVMPNTPALVGEGASGIYAGQDVTEDERMLTMALMSSVSKAAEWVDREELLDVVTGLSGSGPAYFFAFVEHLISSATKLGLSEEQATRLAKQTCFGAGKMLVESSEEPSQLRKNVTSPNGTTHAALVSFEKAGLKNVVEGAVRAATERAEELGKQ